MSSKKLKMIRLEALNLARFMRRKEQKTWKNKDRQTKIRPCFTPP